MIIFHKYKNIKVYCKGVSLLWCTPSPLHSWNVWSLLRLLISCLLILLVVIRTFIFVNSILLLCVSPFPFFFPRCVSNKNLSRCFHQLHIPLILTASEQSKLNSHLSGNYPEKPLADVIESIIGMYLLIKQNNKKRKGKKTIMW